MSPPLAVLATLLLILLVPRRVPLWASFLAACLLLPLLCRQGLGGAGRLLADAAVARGTLAFTTICAGVFVLSSILTHGGHLAAMCDYASSFIGNRRIRAAVMPALVGLVPMPGGAAVSAPLLDRSLGSAAVSATDRNLINYWFRHIWEVSWPLYPAVILASTYKVSDNRAAFVLVQFPLTIVLAIAGYFALLRRVPKASEGVAPRPTPGHLKAVVPLCILIMVPLSGSWGGRVAIEGLIVGIGAAIITALLTAIDRSGLKRVLSDRRIYSMTALAFLVKVFGDLVTATGASNGIGDVIGASGLPHWAAVLLLPFLIGFATGATLTFVTVAFPIVIASSHGALPYLVLGYAGGFIGYLTSPVHMCLVLSTRYFNSKLLSAYARLGIPLLVFLAAAIGLFLLLGGRFNP